MTTPNGPIIFNSTDGSDTAASGLGPAVALTGNGASTTGSSAVVTGISTTGVTAGDLLWVQSSSGRQASIIASVDSSTQVTCDDTFANTESGRTWAIGGKRATIDGSAGFFSPFVTGGVYEFETDQTVTVQTVVTGGTASFVTFQSDNPSVKRTINQTTDNTDIFYCSGSMNLHFKNIKFTNTAAVKRSAIQHASGGVLYLFEDSIIGEENAGFVSGIKVQNYANMHFLKSKVQHCDYGVNATYNNTNSPIRVEYSHFDRCGYGIYSHHRQPVVAWNSIFSNCTTNAIRCPIFFIAGQRIYIRGCIFYNNAVGYDINGYTSQSNSQLVSAVIEDSIFVSNTTAIDSSYISQHFSFKGNAFYGNTTNKTANVKEIYNANEFLMNADPFVDAANGDFNLNTSNAGGRTLRAANYTIGE